MGTIARLLAVMLLLAPAGVAAAPRAAGLHAMPEPAVRSLLMPRDRVEIGYAVDTPGTGALTGTVFVRSDPQRALTPLLMRRGTVTLPSGRALRLSAVVPPRLLAGRQLLYYAAIRDTATGRTLRTAAGRSWILARPTLVSLGAHVFGRTRPPDAVVARAAPGEASVRLALWFRLGWLPAWLSPCRA